MGEREAPALEEERQGLHAAMGQGTIEAIWPASRASVIPLVKRDAQFSQASGASLRNASAPLGSDCSSPAGKRGLAGGVLRAAMVSAGVSG